MMIEAPSTLVTERLVLRMPTAADDQAAYSFSCDPQVTRYMDWRTHTNIQDTIEHRLKVQQEWKAKTGFTWRIAIRDSEQIIGAAAAHMEEHAVSLGYVLARSHWGRGYATEAAGAIFSWASRLEEIYRVWATCDAENRASVRVLEKLGMALEGTLRCRTLRPNLDSTRPRDDLVYAWVRPNPS